jgi:UDP:flavonoid glycosyltransferase YjiC (YdhE family)
MRTNNRKDLERARADLNRNRAALEIALSESLDVGLSDRLVLVATLPSLEIPRPDWPPHAHVVGPCLWDVPGDPFAPPPGDGPLVMIAPSTAYDGDRLLAPALGAVADLGVRAVVTAGAAAMPGALPPNVTTTKARHAGVLPHVDAVVCNGGHGTVVRALSAGVPLVVVPGHGDQQENAFRVERARAGIQVRRRKPTPPPIARALGRVLSKTSYTEAARRIAVEASTLDGPGNAAAIFEAAFTRTPETTEGGLTAAPLPNGGLVSTPPRSPREPGASR